MLEDAVIKTGKYAVAMIKMSVNRVDAITVLVVEERVREVAAVEVVMEVVHHVVHVMEAAEEAAEINVIQIHVHKIVVDAKEVVVPEELARLAALSLTGKI
jgi:hypothetical protein